MKFVRTDLLSPETMPSSETEKLHIYNGLDCCVTLEVLQNLLPQLDNQTRSVYEFSKSLQGPALEMKLRGVLVDQRRRAQVIKIYEGQMAILQANLDKILWDGLECKINWRSPQQMQKLLYEVLKLPVQKYQGKITVNRDALEKLAAYFVALPILNHILALRDIGKKTGVLRTDIDADGRMRTSYNIAGTTTGRFSSSMSDFGSGTNFQNIEEILRQIFIADKGMKFAYIDLEQAESRLVGALCWNIFNDGAYLDACESGDLHTAVSKLAWPGLGWTGTPSLDKQLAESPFYRQHSYRHMAKVLGHGTNYRGSPYTMAKHTKIDQSIIAEFQRVYFRAFSAIPKWHQWTADRLREDGYLVNLTGRKRWFFGRRTDDTTIREAIAYDPQGSVGDILNRGMLQVWRLNICQLLMQIHDAILIQYPEEKEDEVLPLAVAAIQVPVELNNGRTLLIPSEAKVGWNWGNLSKDNPDGLKKYQGHDDRKRTSPSEVNILDRGFL